MIRFVTRILMISTFFIGLGAIADMAWKAVIPAKSECELRQIKVPKQPADVYLGKPIEERKIIIYQQD